MQQRIWLCALALAVASLLAAWAQTGEAAPAPTPTPPPPCTSPEHRQFDFWVGDWDITSSKGDLVGTNRVERIMDGCVVLENWEGKRGIKATSFNLYNATDKKWHQVWVDNQGSLVQLEGGLKDGKMELTGTRLNPKGQEVQVKVTWEPWTGGGVRQVLVTSLDGGKTWRTVFEDVYKRKP
jgi:hypothetical protein